MTVASDLKGVMTALVTPFNADGSLDIGALRSLCERQINAGVGGLVPIGGTGEYPALSALERAKVVETVANVVNGRVPVLAGVLPTGFEDAVDAGISLTKAGADVLMLLTPYYAPGTQDGIAAYFRAYRQRVATPLILYEIPGKTNVSMKAETVRDMAEEGSIIGMKYSSYDMAEFIRVAAHVPEDFALLSGEEPLFASHLAIGACGGIMTTANAFPEIWLEIYKAVVERDDLKAALDIQHKIDPLIQLAFSESNPGPLKEILAAAGNAVGEPRLPLARPKSPKQAQILLAVEAIKQQFYAKHLSA